MNYYEGICCLFCHEEVCATCGCCQNPSCENCNFPEVKKDIENYKKEK